jgi:hypothetical protein
MDRNSLVGVLLAVAAFAMTAACAGASASANHARPPEEEGTAPAAVRAGHYRLSLSMTCRSKLETATGLLTLQPMSGSLPPSESSLPSSSEAALLWGQTNLDLARFLSCLGDSVSASDEPIHPSVLVEVLRWDGEPQQQVLLVSTEAADSVGDASGVGVAMWVERVEPGHIAGVWSRWELMGRGEGRWEADLLSGE